MALARIITRSQTCSQELSLVLLARGYTVEIVSPDKVPDNAADLELRVDAGPGNQLLANVETHGGDRTASLKFVHHLKAPMMEFIHQPSDPGEQVDSSGEPVAFNTGSGVAYVQRPKETPELVPRATSPAVESLFNPVLEFEIDSEEEACTVGPQVLSLSPVQPAANFAVTDAAVSPLTRLQVTSAQTTIVLTESAAQRRDHSAPWPWRAALAFAGVVLLAVFLGFSVRHSSSAAPPGERIAASTGVSSSRAIGAEKDATSDPLQIQAAPWPLTDADPFGNSSRAMKDPQAVKADTATRGPRPAGSRTRGDDVVAPNTTIYFDKRYEPAPKTKRPQLKKKVHP